MFENIVLNKICLNDEVFKQHHIYDSCGDVKKKDVSPGDITNFA